MKNRKEDVLCCTTITAILLLYCFPAIWKRYIYHWKSSKYMKHEIVLNSSRHLWTQTLDVAWWGQMPIRRDDKVQIIISPFHNKTVIVSIFHQKAK